MSSNEIDPSQIAQLQRLAKTYSTGEMICIEGEPTQDLMLMLRGLLRCSRGKRDQHDSRSECVFGSWLSFLWCPTPHRRLCARRLVAEIVWVREDKVVGLLSVMPSLSVKLIRDIAEMFLQKEEQVTRFQQYGGGACDAMKTQGIAEIAFLFLPALVVFGPPVVFLANINWR